MKNPIFRNMAKFITVVLAGLTVAVITFVFLPVTVPLVFGHYLFTEKSFTECLFIILAPAFLIAMLLRTP
jgi:hypothetical protein